MADCAVDYSIFSVWGFLVSVAVRDGVSCPFSAQDTVRSSLSVLKGAVLALSEPG